MTWRRASKVVAIFCAAGPPAGAVALVAALVAEAAFTLQAGLLGVLLSFFAFTIFAVPFSYILGLGPALIVALFALPLDKAPPAIRLTAATAAGAFIAGGLHTLSDVMAAGVADEGQFLKWAARLAIAGAAGGFVGARLSQARITDARPA